MSLSQKGRRVKPGGSVEGFLWNSQEYSGISQDFSVQNISKLAERETHGWSLGSHLGFGFLPWDPPLGFGVPFLGSLLGFGLLSQDPTWVWGSFFGILPCIWSSLFGIPPCVWTSWDPSLGLGSFFL